MSGSSAGAVGEAGAAGLLLEAFTGYLGRERGVSVLTVDAYVADVARFLSARGGCELSQLRAADVSEAVLGEVGERSPASVRRFGCALRSFLRYCYVVGVVDRDLSAAALPVSGRRRSLPQGITPTQEKALLRACDRRRASGRRDYAVIVLMLRLGLRASEVATLRLDDLDWRAGQVTVRGKGARVDELPLPVDVGEAIAVYLRHGRPRVATAQGGVPARAAAPGRPDPWRGDRHRCWRRSACRSWCRSRPPATSHGGDGHAAGGRPARRDRSGVAAPLAGFDRRLRAGGRRTAARDCAAVADRGGVVSTLVEHLDDYLRLRRGLGFQLGRHGEVLPHFVAFVDAHGAATVTVELAAAWARLPEGLKPITVDFRISAVRGFARYLHALDPAHEIPPAGLLAAPRRRPSPYIYSPEDIVKVLGASRQLRPPLRAVTYRALLGLLAVTGMRSGEAFALIRGDVDLVEGLVTVRHAKFDRMRLVPLHRSVTAEMRDYATTRDRLCPAPTSDRFFVSVTGRPLRRGAADEVFRELTTAVGLRTEAVHPGMHGLRHTFAVRTLIDAYRRGADISSLLPVLSTYLGNVEPANTYWYLSAVPELMQLAAARLEQHEAGRS
jgi:integrase/recombinase XerD